MSLQGEVFEAFYKRRDDRLLELLDEVPLDDVEARAYAAMCVGRRRLRAALPDLVRMADDTQEPERVREQALRALRRMPHPSAVPVLARALEDPSPELRELASEILDEFSPRAQAAEPALIAALDDDHAPVRLNAAWALAPMSDGAAVPALVRHAADREETIRMRQVSLYALRLIGTQEARRAVDDVLAGESGLTRWRLRRLLKCFPRAGA